MAEVRFVPVEDWHVDYVADHMRREDVDEVAALGNFTPQGALRISLSHHGHAWTGLIDGVPACVFGVIPLTAISDIGVPWMLGTDLLVKHWRLFARTSREVIADIHTRYPVLANAAYVKSTLSLRWLRWLGAQISIHEKEARFVLCAM